MAFLDQAFLLALGQLLQHLEILQLGAKLVERLADVDTLLNRGNDGLKFIDGRCGRSKLSLFLRPLPVHGGDFRLVLRDLRQQKLALNTDERLVGSLWQMECVDRVVGIGERRAQARNIELCGLQITPEAIDLAFIDGGIEFD